jgi:hypothetical protein
MNIFDGARQAIISCEGFAIHFLNFSMLDGQDVLEIGLHWDASRPEMTLSFRRIYYFALGKSPQDDTPLIDKVEVSEVVPSDEAWPSGLANKMNVVRTADLPHLLWVRTEGPVRLEVVAAMATVHQEIRPATD